MSKYVYLYRYRKKYKSSSEIPRGERPLILGGLPEVQEVIARVFSGVNWNDPHHGRWSFSAGQIEFIIGLDMPIQAVCVGCVRTEAIDALLLRLCNANGWIALDPSTGMFLSE